MRRRFGMGLSALVLSALVLPGQEWSRFRGPNGSGLAPDFGYPVEFDSTQNLVWASPARPGKSSPVLSRRHVFLTASEGEKLYTQCFDRDSGELAWERSLERPRQEIAHEWNDPAASSPVTDGENVYAFFRDFGLVAYDAGGRTLWDRPLGSFSNYMGLASSLILHEDVLILLVDQGGASYLAAFHIDDGRRIWKADRDDRLSWSTPVLRRPDDGEPEIITAASHRIDAHSVRTGSLLWTWTGLSAAIAPSPVLADDAVYAVGYGYQDPLPFGPTLARLDRDGDGRLSPSEYGRNAWLAHVGKTRGGPERVVTREAWDAAFPRSPSGLLAVRLASGADGPRELWRYERSLIGVIPSPLALDGVLYFVKNGGVLTALDAETGEVLKAGRLTGAIQPYSASPVAAEGRVYLAGEHGDIAVVQAGRDWQVLAVNRLEEPIFATPALSGGSLYIRTAGALHRFSSRSAPKPVSPNPEIQPQRKEQQKGE